MPPSSVLSRPDPDPARGPAQGRLPHLRPHRGGLRPGRLRLRARLRGVDRHPLRARHRRRTDLPAPASTRSRRCGPDERFFLFLHTYTVHDPYEPPPAYREPALDGAATGGRVRSDRPELRQPTTCSVLDGDAGGDRLVRGLYDAGIRYLDDQLAAFFGELERIGARRRHGRDPHLRPWRGVRRARRLVHTQAYPECLHIPLIVVAPGRERRAGRAGGRDGRLRADDLRARPASQPPARAAGQEPRRRARRTRSGARGLRLGREQADRLRGAQRSCRRWAAASTSSIAPPPSSSPTASGSRAGSAFDARPPWLEFRAVAFATPRKVEAFADGRKIADLEIGTDWETHRLALPDVPGHVRVRLWTPECTTPVAVGVGSDDRCLSFKIHGAPLERLELFDLAADRLRPGGPLRERPDLVRTLGLALKRYPETPRAPAAQGNAERRAGQAPQGARVPLSGDR